MAKEKSKDIRLLKITGRVSASKMVTMAYVLFELDIARTASEVTINTVITPIVKNTPDGEPILDNETAGISQDNQFKRENKLTCNIDLIGKSIKFPHLNRYKVSKNFRGYGISTYAMNEIATILKTQYPDFVVEPVHFSFEDSGEDVDRGSFFAFMEKFGFWFRFDGENNNKGILNIERAEMLKLAVKKDTLQELEIAPFIKSLFTDRSNLQAEIGRIKTEFNERNRVFNRFEKDQAITFLMNIVGGLVLLILIILFL